MMLAASTGVSPQLLFHDAKLVWEGRVVPLLLWDKHPQAVVLAGFLAFVILAWLGRLFRPRSRPQTPVSGA